jgi:hypothetical protein
MTAAPRTIPSEQNPEPASVWFCPFLDLSFPGLPTGQPVYALKRSGKGLGNVRKAVGEIQNVEC